MRREFATIVIGLAGSAVFAFLYYLVPTMSHTIAGTGFWGSVIILIVGLVILFLPPQKEEPQRVNAKKVTLTEFNEGIIIGVTLHNGDRQKFNGYLQVVRLNGIELLNPITLGKAENSEFYSHFVLSNCEKTPIVMAYFDDQGRPIIIGEHLQTRLLSKKKNTVETKLFGELGSDSIIPKEATWEIRIMDSGKLNLRKIS